MAQRIPLDQLHPAPWNPRTIRDARFQNLMQSIQADPAFLELRPILATLDGTIYAGNQKYRAVEQLGWTDVPAELTDIPEWLAKERALKDNLHFGDDVQDDLEAIVAELRDAGHDVMLLGFEEHDITRMLEHMPESPPPDLETLGAQLGEPGERDFWPRIALSVPPETHQLYQHLLALLPGEDDALKFGAILGAVDETALSSE